MEDNIIKNNVKNAYRIVRELNWELFVSVNEGRIGSYSIHYQKYYLSVFVSLRIATEMKKSVSDIWSVSYDAFAKEDGWKAIQDLEDKVLDYVHNAEEYIAEFDKNNLTVEQKLAFLEEENKRLKEENNNLKSLVQ